MNGGTPYTALLEDIQNDSGAQPTRRTKQPKNCPARAEVSGDNATITLHSTYIAYSASSSLSRFRATLLQLYFFTAVAYAALPCCVIIDRFER